MEAYQAYLSGMRTGPTEREEDLEFAVDMFERAIEFDPDFALAYAGLAEMSSRMIHHRIDLSPERLAIAANAADRAVELEPDLPETHRARGLFYYLALRDYDRALKELSIAASKKPGESLTLAAVAYVERRQNKWHDSLLHMEMAIRLDPRNGSLSWNQGISYMFLRDYEQAVKQMERAISLGPGRSYYWLAETYRLWDGSQERARALLESMPRESHPTAVYAWLVEDFYERNFKRALGRLRGTSETIIEVRDQIFPTALVGCECLLALGRPEIARRSCEEALLILGNAAEERPDDPRIYSALGKTHALLGNKDEAIRHGQRAVTLWPVSKDAVDGCSFELYLAEIFALTGEPELATAKLEYLLSIPSRVSPADLRFNPKWDPLRDHPRFQALLEEYEVE
jgi:serine/threonine-protein kinase